ncbi:hypothetical protein CEXT_588881 [Caerostris extrusa]|uniref:Uncharacterized protein n=1 Tax=Caerostris extrusa TaxID=172846 RepID=A0AAV4TSF4_CAEEX|nr:hypothetical protein CEXT_588881 [Caerostris extrusa]
MRSVVFGQPAQMSHHRGLPECRAGATQRIRDSLTFPPSWPLFFLFSRNRQKTTCAKNFQLSPCVTRELKNPLGGL